MKLWITSFDIEQSKILNCIQNASEKYEVLNVPFSVPIWLPSRVVSEYNLRLHTTIQTKQ